MAEVASPISLARPAGSSVDGPDVEVDSLLLTGVVELDVMTSGGIVLALGFRQPAGDLDAPADHVGGIEGEATRPYRAGDGVAVETPQLSDAPSRPDVPGPTRRIGQPFASQITSTFSLS